MRLRRVVISTLVLGLAASSLQTATAATKKKPAPKKLCNLLSDNSGDAAANLAGVTKQGKSEVADIISGDIATGAKEVVGVLRLASTTMSSTDTARLGVQWSMAATLQNQDFQFWAKRGTNNGPLTGGVKLGDVALSTTPPAIVGNTFVWKIPRSAVKPLAKKNQVFTDMRGDSEIFSSTSDQAPVAGTKLNKYPDRAASCVAAR